MAANGGGTVDRGLSFGQEVMLLRRRRDLSIDDVAGRSGLSPAMISQVERDRRTASPRAVGALLDAFAPDPEGDRLAALAAETYRRLELNLDGLDRDRIDLVVQLRRVVSRLTPEAVQSIRSALATAG